MMSPPTCLWPFIKPGGEGGDGRKRRSNRYYYHFVEQGGGPCCPLTQTAPEPPRPHAQRQEEVPACRRCPRKRHPPPIAFQAGPAGLVKPCQTDDTQPHPQRHTGTCSSIRQSAPTQSNSDPRERRRTHQECESGRSRPGVDDRIRLNWWDGLKKKEKDRLQNGLRSI